VSAYGLPVLYALMVWWFSTGLVLVLVGLSRRSFRWSMAAVTVVLALALYGMAAASADASTWSAYVAFTCAVLVWAWPEMAFLFGLVTGPRPHALPPGSGGRRRLSYAIQAILYHELALVVAGAAVVAATWGGVNQVGAWTFATLWMLRLSAKLNLFLGVRTANDELLPAHLAFLKSFFAEKPINLLFPVSITVSTVAAVLIMVAAMAPRATAFDVTGLMLVAALVALGLLEHWFMVMPWRVAALWGWAARERAARAPPVATPIPSDSVQRPVLSNSTRG